MDVHLRELCRKAQLGDELDRQRYEAALQRAGFPSWYPWRVIPKPNVRPYSWAKNVNHWAASSYYPTHGSIDLELQFAHGIGTPTRIIVRNTSYNEAIETAADWLAENQPGFLTLPVYPVDEDNVCLSCDSSFDDPCEHLQAAEADLIPTGSGWLDSSENAYSELEYLPTLVSALERAIPFDPEEEDTKPDVNYEPLIVFGAFWDAYSIYPRRQSYFPPDWLGVNILDVIADDLPESSRVFVTEPDFEDPALYVCWREVGDDPLGDESEEYAEGWEKLDINLNDSPQELWALGIEYLLSEVHGYKPADPLY